MKLSALLSSLPDTCHIQRDVDVVAVTADSREVTQGSLFFALAGQKTNGEKFIQQAIEKGAVAIVVDNHAQLHVPTSVEVVKCSDPRSALAKIASVFFGAHPQTIVGITGTNGKTSVAAFLRQLWDYAQLEAASIGTVGVVTRLGTQGGSHTTPDPITLAQTLARLHQDGVTHVALEASSHGLHQHRLDGVRFYAGAFTNLTRDHLDYHATMDAYALAKARLFSEVVVDGGVAVINRDGAGADLFENTALKRGLRVITVGLNGDDLKLIHEQRQGFASALDIDFMGQRRTVMLPLVGDFQISNALVAAGLALGCGMKLDTLVLGLEKLKGASGRLEYIGQKSWANSSVGAPVFVDYAHTPDALEKALQALRPYVKGSLSLVFGCGGDRDAGKRPQMGHVAAQCADRVIVTDDNPRSEVPSDIRKQILAAVPAALEIGDRREAIFHAVRHLVEGDVLLVAGKGHEIGQTIGSVVHPFSDADVVIAALNEDKK